MPQQQDERPDKVKLQFARSEAFVKVYANNVQIETSTWDCRLTFGETTMVQGKRSVEQVVSVVMSPQHAKALAGLLANQLMKYEEKLGPIRFEPADESVNSAGQKSKTAKTKKA